MSKLNHAVVILENILEMFRSYPLLRCMFCIDLERHCFLSTDKQNLLFFLLKNCWQIINYSLPSRKKPHYNLLSREKYPQKRKVPQTNPLVPENCFQRIKPPFRNFKLHLRSNMIGWIVRPRNLEKLFTVRCC